MSNASVRSPRKRIAIFLDGTWNNTKSNTNVWRLAALCAAHGRDGVPQVTHYNIGVNGLWGGIFGKGVAANVIDAYEWLVGQYNPEDEIFIFGFSRGAFTARSLAGFIAKYGLVKPGAPLGASTSLRLIIQGAPLQCCFPARTPSRIMRRAVISVRATR
ncbi:DUF2235 domain-containing protein [Chelativorans sp. AA-79]|uniref:T6SS phospholipase effector Tle1-like catalytic domain-containing protein n=1 Tax=Chelativorans sp. AA-79 TaxID=3028735 RepID=UPI0023F98D54|nr:DUF2235 domain-containing protein [Chelativorans sp. AA-79]WEX12307.1 DUF2235 domain-containing protein [Chelativorans sp. AA-79]